MLIEILIALMFTGVESDVEEQPDVLGGIMVAEPSGYRLIADGPVYTADEFWDLSWVLGVAFLLGSVHVIGPRIRKLMQSYNKEAILGAIGG